MILDVLLGLYILASPAGIDGRDSSPDLFAHHSSPLPTVLGFFRDPLRHHETGPPSYSLASFPAALAHLHHSPSLPSLTRVPSQFLTGVKLDFRFTNPAPHPLPHPISHPCLTWAGDIYRLFRAVTDTVRVERGVWRLKVILGSDYLVRPFTKL